MTGVRIYITSKGEGKIAEMLVDNDIEPTPALIRKIKEGVKAAFRQQFREEIQYFIELEVDEMERKKADESS